MANGLVAFFIPYPYAANDHQYFNAKFLVDKNLAWLKRENDTNIKNEILNILDEENGFGSDNNSIKFIHSQSGDWERDRDLEREKELVPNLLIGNKLSVSLALLDKLKVIFSE